MADRDPIQGLVEVLETERGRIVRLWSKRLRAELWELELPGRDLRAPLEAQLTELARLLRERGTEATSLWPEAVRAHGVARYEQRFEPEDLAREYKALQQVLLRVYTSHFGGITPEAADLITDLVGEASAAVFAAYSHVVKSDEARFREASVMESILHDIDVGIWVAEPDGALSFATPPVTRLLGMPARALIGRRPRETLTHLLRELKAKHLTGTPFHASEIPFLRALEEREPVHNVWIAITRPDGQEAILEMSAVPIWQEGEPPQLVGVVQTLTDRTETAQKTQQLERAYDELRRLQGRLLQRTRTQALGQLASGAAHALNNFLNVLRLRITLLRREFKPDHLDALDRTVRSIGDLVSRLQEFSVQRTDEELTAADFNALVREAVELVRADLMESPRPINLEAHLTAHGKVNVDASFFRELVVNLLLAAHRRMPEGGPLNVASSASGGWVSLDIEDSGPPFTAEEQQRLFDPLKGKGSEPQLSLLLAVARSQVQRWGGELTCDNAVGTKGGAFHIRLPATEQVQPERPTPAPPPRPARGPTRTVLVVDDELENARMMAEVLRDEGYEVQVAHTADEALQRWEHQHFDAALLDALMPDRSGWELARELRRRTPQALLAMVTGMDVRGQNRANLALVDAVFRKPVDVSALDEFLSQEPQRSEAPVEPGPSVH